MLYDKESESAIREAWEGLSSRHSSFRIELRCFCYTEVDLSTVAPEGSAVHIIDELVDSLDTRAIEESYEVNSENGRPPFHPKTLLKVALLALHSSQVLTTQDGRRHDQQSGLQVGSPAL